jgi:hypothetical protein
MPEKSARRGARCCESTLKYVALLAKDEGTIRTETEQGLRN